MVQVYSCLFHNSCVDSFDLEKFQLCLKVVPFEDLWGESPTLFNLLKEKENGLLLGFTLFDVPSCYSFCDHLFARK